MNRTKKSSLEVQIFADNALPVVYDRLTTWEVECPDIVQQMLLAGVAVDSPADAAVLHRGLFSNVDQAKKAFGRAAPYYKPFGSFDWR